MKCTSINFFKQLFLTRSTGFYIEAPNLNKKSNSNIEVHFNGLKIFLLYFYDVYDVNLWEKIRLKYSSFMHKNVLSNSIILWQKNRHSWRLNNSRKTFLNQWESMDFRKTAISIYHDSLDKLTSNIPIAKILSQVHLTFVSVSLMIV